MTVFNEPTVIDDVNTRRGLMGLGSIALSVLVVHGTVEFLARPTLPILAAVILASVLTTAIVFSVVTGWLVGWAILGYGFVVAPDTAVPSVAMVVVALLSYGAIKQGVPDSETRKRDDRGYRVDDGMEFGGE